MIMINNTTYLIDSLKTEGWTAAFEHTSLGQSISITDHLERVIRYSEFIHITGKYHKPFTIKTEGADE